MLSLFSRTAASRAPSMFVLPAFRNATRRTLLTTAVRFEPASKTKTKATTTKKAPAKKTPAKSATKAIAKKSPKAAAPKKEKVKKAKKPKPEKPAPLTKADLPPKRPPPAYIIFYQRYMRGLPQIPRGRDEITQCAKDAGGAWKQMTELEKQPFFEESKAAFAQYSKDRSEYVANVDSSVLKRVNARRIKLGKPRVRSSAGAARIGPFTLFLKENALSVRESFAGQGLSSKELISATGKEASVRWKALSETEQEDYRKRAAELRAAANAAA